jgi:hypothetical protein
MRVPVPDEAPDGADAGESVQLREEPLDDRIELKLGGDAAALDWQPELDSALEAIDSCLPVKRRRATDPPGTSYPRPEVSVLTFMGPAYSEGELLGFGYALEQVMKARQAPEYRPTLAP